MDTEPFETIQESGFPLVRQFSVFLENRVGALLQLTKAFDPTDLHIMGLSVMDSVDCSIIRMIIDDADKGYEVLANARFPVCESELAVVSLPRGPRALLHLLTALLTGEVNVHYTYPLLARPLGRPALAIASDNPDDTVCILREKNLTVLDHKDLSRKF